MRILPLSLCLFLAAACASYPKKMGFRSAAPFPEATINPYFADVSKDYVYKASITAFDRKFGGILIIKKLGKDRHRIAFTTEMGNTLFDFSFDGDAFKVNRILKEMDRKLLINILKRDFKALITEHPSQLQTFENNGDVIFETEIRFKKHYFYRTDGQLHRIVRVGNAKEKVVIRFSEIDDNSARSIQIKHMNLDLAIDLTSLK